MGLKIYTAFLVIVIALAAIAIYGTSNVTGNIAAESEDSGACTLQAPKGPCTTQQSCGQPSCAAPEGRPCGCGSTCALAGE